MRRNNPKRDEELRLQSLAKALNTPTDDVDTMTDTEITAYLLEHGKDPVKLHAALLERIAKISQTSTSHSHEASNGEQKNLMTSKSLKEHLDSKEITVDELSITINIPFGVSLSLVKNTLDSPPVKLIKRVSNLLGIDPYHTAFIMEQIPRLTPSHSVLLRSNSGVTSLPNRRRTFREAMLQCKENGELTLEQEQDWEEELCP
jgi:hypothetical protein